MRLLLIISFFIICQASWAREGSQGFTIATPFVKDAPPYMWRDQNNQMVGSFIDAFELIADRQGYQIDWYFYSPGHQSAQLTKDYKKGKIDIITNVIPSTIPKLLLRPIDTHLLTTNMHVFVPNDSTLANLSIEALPEYTGIVGPIVKNSLPYLINKHPILAKLPPLLLADNLSSIITAFDNQKVDYSIADRSIISIRLRELGLNNQYHIMNPPIGEFETIAHYRKGSGFESFLSEFVELSIVFKNNGRLDHIKEKNMRRYLRQFRQTQNTSSTH